MKAIKFSGAFLSLLLVLSAAVPASAAGPSFQATSISSLLRREGRAESVGAVTITVSNPSASTTIAAGSSLTLTYSASVSAPASPVSANVTCIIGGVSGCPGSVSVQVNDLGISLGFNSNITLTNAGDGFSFVQVRVDASALPAATTTVTAFLSGHSSNTANPISLTQSQFTVGNLASALGPASFATADGQLDGMYACSPPGLSAIGFNLSFTEGFSSAFTTLAQETAAAAATNPTNGSNLEVILTNVPAGVVITPIGFNGSSNSLGINLPAAQTSSGAPMTFSFSFSATSPAIETAVLNFTAGFTNQIALSAISASPISAKLRLGPVSTATPPTVVSFIDNTLATGQPFVMLPCTMTTTPPTSIGFQVVAGSGPSPLLGSQIYESHGVNTAFTAVGSTVTGGNWLIVSPNSATAPANINVGIDATNLTAGTYKGQVLVSAVGATPLILPVTLVVTPNVPIIAVNQSSFSFAGLIGAANPASQSFNLSNSGGGTFNWTATPSTTSGGNWLAVSPASGSGALTLTISVDDSKLAAGTYNGLITVTVPGASNSPQAFSVTLVVTAPPSIALTAPSLTFVSDVGGSPANQTTTVNNSGGGSLGVTVTTATASGGSWLTATPSTGVAPLTLTVAASTAGLAAGTYQGTITVTALASAGANNSPQTVSVTLAVGTPVIFNKGVVNAASYASGAAVTPGSIASLFGNRLSGATASSTTVPLLTTLGGTQVMVNGVAAPLFYVSPGQINFQMPVEATAANSTIAVISGTIQSPPLTVPSGAITPAIFTATGTGSGQAAAANANGSANSAANPATAGSTISLFATGLGATTPPVATNQVGASAPPTSALNVVNATVTATVGGVNATVGFAGLAPGFIGLYQVNVTIPQGTASGAAQVQLSAAGASSNTATIAIK